jgi:large subunit ribosomal protein L22
MTGPKLNEKSYVAGERSGTKATAKYVRSSASKARVVLDLIRGLDVTSADQVLQFTERHIAHDVRKVLASAVANAVNNDGQDAEELFVLACFADEGPTLRRFRPRARGRASRINKRTCHITVIVARMSDERIEIVQAREERAGGSAGRGRPTSSSASRRARVERSRQRDAEQSSDVDETTADGDAADDDSATDEANASAEDGDADVQGAVAPGEWAGSAEPLEDGGAPEGYEIKGNAQSMLYHEPDSRYYKATKAEVWFDSVESAEAAVFAKPGAAKADDQQSATSDDASAPAEGSAGDEAEADQTESPKTDGEAEEI